MAYLCAKSWPWTGANCWPPWAQARRPRTSSGRQSIITQRAASASRRRSSNWPTCCSTNRRWRKVWRRARCKARSNSWTPMAAHWTPISWARWSGWTRTAAACSPPSTPSSFPPRTWSFSGPSSALACPSASRPIARRRPRAASQLPPAMPPHWPRLASTTTRQKSLRRPEEPQVQQWAQPLC